MLIFFGTRGITSHTQSGSFHCPACGGGAQYSQKSVRRFFTLFFVPLIPLNQVADYVECHRCGGTFKPEVLTWNGAIPQLPPPLPGSPQQAFPVNLSGQAFPPASTTITSKGNGLATASMILGILGLVTSFLSCPAIVFVPLSLIFGVIALIRVKNGGGVVGGKGAAMAGLACSLAGIIVMAGMAVYLINSKPTPSERSTSPRAKAVANLKGKAASTHYGNSDQARDLARQYAEMIQSLDAISFASTTGKANSGRQYVVHCELREKTCAFLVYVPDYRKFKDDAKDSLEQLAWVCAQKIVTQSGGLAEDAEICVGLKGMLIFGSIMTGSAGAKEPSYNGTDEKVIDHYFTAPEPPAKNTDSATPAKLET